MPQPMTEAPATPDRRPAPFPHEYVVGLEWPGSGPGSLKASPRAPIVGGAPPQFLGQESWWSPEHLLLSSVSLCLMTTFEVFAAKQSLRVSHYRSLVKGVLDKSPTGIAFSSIVLDVELEVPAADIERAEALLRSAKKHCIVANSLKTSVDLRTEVRPDQADAPRP